MWLRNIFFLSFFFIQSCLANPAFAGGYENNSWQNDEVPSAEEVKSWHAMPKNHSPTHNLVMDDGTPVKDYLKKNDPETLKRYNAAMKDKRLDK